MKRRELLKTASTVVAASALTARAAGDQSPPEIVDSNVSLFRWPFRRLPLDETDLLVEKMGSLGIGRALAGSFEGVFQRDAEAVNRQLAEACSGHPELVPIGSVNPASPGWEDDFRRCVGEHGMPGVRLHPNYHDYALDHPGFLRLLEMAAEAEAVVQVAAAMEDVRTQNDIARAPDVDLAPLPDAMKRAGGGRVQLLNWRPRGTLSETLATTPGIHFDTARIDATDGIAVLLETVPADRILFGTHAPFLIPEAALIRAVHENELEAAPLRRILSGNANQLFKLPTR
ncbi:MAG: amidohydrolase family protein [Verrucomicrobiales bacterium]